MGYFQTNKKEVSMISKHEIILPCGCQIKVFSFDDGPSIQVTKCARHEVSFRVSTRTAEQRPIHAE